MLTVRASKLSPPFSHVAETLGLNDPKEGMQYWLILRNIGEKGQTHKAGTHLRGVMSRLSDSAASGSTEFMYQRRDA